MTKIKKIFIVFLIVLALIILLIIINGFRGGKKRQSKYNSATAIQTNTTVNEEKETVETYTCPMHPEINFGRSGKCPKCGRQLIVKED